MKSINSSLFWALAVGTVLRIFLALATPTGFEDNRRGVSWYNDERAHANYVRHLVERREFPVETNSVKKPGAFARGDFEYYQPPLAYLAMAPAWWVGERVASGWLFARLLNGLLGIATIAVVWNFVARAHSRRAADWAAWILAVLPSFCYQGTLVSNDPAFWLLSALFILVAAQVAQGRGPWLLAPLAACLLLTKSSAIVLLPLPLIATAFSKQDGFRLRKVAWISLALVVGCLTAFPWYLRNQHLYGSWLALETGHGPAFAAMRTMSDLPVLKMLVGANLASLWFPMDALWAYRAVPRLLFAVGTLAWIAPLVLAGRRVLAFRPQWPSIAAILLSLAAFGPYALRYQQSDARLLFHLFPAYFALWAVSVTPRTDRWGCALLLPQIAVWGWIGVRFLTLA